MKYDFSELQSVFGGTLPPSMKVNMDYENLYAVHTTTVFHNVHLIRSDEPLELRTRELAEKINSGDTKYFQRFDAEIIGEIRPIKSDSDYVQILKSTEQESMTLEKFTKARHLWLKNITVIE